MSLAQEARAVRERIAARLRELEPLVAEYNELQKVAAEMGVETQEPSPPAVDRKGEPGRTPRRSTTRAGRSASRDSLPDSSAGRTANDEFVERVLEAVRDQPGKTVGEYAELLSLSPARLYRPMRELTSAGAIVKRARRLFPA